MSHQRIQATAGSDHVEYGTADIRSYSPREVLIKSLQKLGMFWGLAIFSILLPVVHFVLTPLFFILGIYLSVRARKFRHEILSGSIHCPHCKTPVTIGKAAFFEEHTEICQNCASVVRISIPET
ncbi:hypothetical protein ACNH6C_11320 [Bdellovibrio bacteriovorus]|uniref:hypothetical protein n=1 Tax=Bdellovibrio bacteriovorus TaxID=959 RepID=UPI003A8083D6